MSSFVEKYAHHGHAEVSTQTQESAKRATVLVSGPTGCGTGFLIDGTQILPRKREMPKYCIMTNHHVVKSKSDTYEFRAHFGYESGNSIGVAKIRLDPDLFYESDEKLDFALIALNHSDFFSQQLNKQVSPISVVERPELKEFSTLHVYHHRAGQDKKYSAAPFDSYPDFNKGEIRYKLATDKGSSGAPIFNHKYEIIAINFGGSQEYNVGTLITHVYAKLRGTTPPVYSHLDPKLFTRPNLIGTPAQSQNGLDFEAIDITNEMRQKAMEYFRNGDGAGLFDGASHNVLHQPHSFTRSLFAAGGLDKLIKICTVLRQQKVVIHLNGSIDPLIDRIKEIVLSGTTLCGYYPSESDRNDLIYWLRSNNRLSELCQNPELKIHLLNDILRDCNGFDGAVKCLSYILQEDSKKSNLNHLASDVKSLINKFGEISKIPIPITVSRLDVDLLKLYLFGKDGIFLFAGEFGYNDPKDLETIIKTGRGIKQTLAILRSLRKDMNKFKDLKHLTTQVHQAVIDGNTTYHGYDPSPKEVEIFEPWFKENALSLIKPGQFLSSSIVYDLLRAAGSLDDCKKILTACVVDNKQVQNDISLVRLVEQEAKRKSSQSFTSGKSFESPMSLRPSYSQSSYTNMSIKELKSLLSSANIDISNIIEKTELIRLAERIEKQGNNTNNSSNVTKNSFPASSTGLRSTHNIYHYEPEIEEDIQNSNEDSGAKNMHIKCFHCDDNLAAVICQHSDCNDDWLYLCAGCDKLRHKAKSRQSHLRKAIQ